MRAAEAAKDTSRLIDSVVKKIQEGTALIDLTSHDFHEVTDSSEKIGVLVAEIASASNEQKKGIEQVNIAITEIDGVTQQNAANAEESAATSEEMSTQGTQMKKFVEALTIIIGTRTKPGSHRFFGKKNKKSETAFRNTPSLPEAF